MFAVTRLRLPIIFIVVVAFATLLALAAFSSAVDARQDDAAKEKTDATTTEENAQEGPITIEQHSWGNYHWARTSNPFTLKLGDNVSSAWDSYLKTAAGSPDTTNINDWSDSSVLDAVVDSGQSNRKNCPARAGRVETCNSTYGQTSWLGIATIWASGSHITQGTTKLNDTYFNTAKYNTPGWRRLVMCQEVGHTFGLGHQDENFSNTNLGTCMDYTNAPDGGGTYGNGNGYPNAHDYEQLRAIYDPTFTSTSTATVRGHLDSTTTSTQTSTGNDNQSGNGPPAWGKEKYRSEDGQFSVFEKDLGNDNKKITHVFWTEERAAQHRGNRGNHDDHEE